MEHFDKKVKTVLAQYHQRMEAEATLADSLPDAERARRIDEFLLAVGTETGNFLNTLLRSAKSSTILEIGTSYGYSTVWLAEAARAIGGRLITLEISPEKADYARQKIREAGLAEVVEFRVGDALDKIAHAAETFDFVLLDLWKELYVPCFDLFFPKLKSGAWVVADNMTYPPQHLPEATAYRKRVRETGAFDTVLLPIGSGLELSFFKNKS